jgi:lysophospholipase L1-like esterase
MIFAGTSRGEDTRRNEQAMRSRAVYVLQQSAKRNVLLAGGLLLLLSIAASATAEEPLLQPHDRVAICGDQITANQGYALHLADYLMMCQGVEDVDVAQFGWGGQTAEAFLAKLDTDLLPFKPTVAMTCFGMTDAGRKALAEETAQRYRKAMTAMVQVLRKGGVRTIILGSAKCVDSFHYHKDPAQAAITNKALSALAVITEEVAAKEGAIYADVFGATMKTMTALKELHGKEYAFDNQDGYGPGPGCKLAMAYAFLRALGCDGNLGTVTIDYKAETATCDPAQKIVGFDGRAATIKSTRYPFLYLEKQILAESIIKCLPFNEELNRFTLVVKNVPSPRLKVSWNVPQWSELRAHESRDFTAEEAAQGIIISSGLDPVPFGRFQDVHRDLWELQNLERTLKAAFVNTEEGRTRRAAQVKKARDRFKPIAHKFRLQTLSEERKRYTGPINAILDTDMSGDCDDAGALALLLSFTNQKECNLIACVVNGRDVDLCSGATVHAICAYYGHPDMPIGANHGEPWLHPTKSHYTLKTRERFAKEFPTDDKLPAGVTVYRKALAGAADGTVVIVSVGFMESILGLLESKPDEISELSGLELIQKKVREFVIMANSTVHDNKVSVPWPTPIRYTFGVGSYLSTGKSLSNTPEENPVRFVYQHFGNEKNNALKDGRQSWDLTAAWLAVRGTGELWDESWGGHWNVDPKTGACAWVGNADENRTFILERMHVPDVQKMLEAELSRPPK